MAIRQRVQQPLSIEQPLLFPNMFVGTKWDTSLIKAEFGNWLVRFIQDDFPRGRFTDEKYRRLSNCFGHIAHYDKNGFYETQFSTYQRKHSFIANMLMYPCYGDPVYTYCDVERAVIQRLNQHNVLDFYFQKMQKEFNDERVRQFDKLKKELNITE